MGVFEQFPYSNFHDLNLDWILEEIKKFQTSIEQTEHDIDDMQHDITEFEASVQTQIDEFSDQMESAVSQVLAELGVQPLPIVGGADNGKVLTVVAGTWGVADVGAGNMPTLSSDDYRKSIRVSESGDYRAEELTEIVGPFQTINSTTHRIGFMTGSSPYSWNYTNNPAYRFVIIPVEPGDHMKLESWYINSDKATYYAVLKSFTGTGTNPDFATGFTQRISLTAPTSSAPVKFADIVIPSDGHYFYLAITNNNADIIPSIVEKNGVDILGSDNLAGNILDLAAKTADEKIMAAFGPVGAQLNVTWEMGTWSTSDGVGKPLRPSNNQVRQRTLPAKSPIDITLITASGYTTSIFYLDSDKNYVSSTAYLAGAQPIPKNTWFALVFRNTAGTDISDVNPTDVISLGVTALSNAMYSLPVEACILGDSIAQGVYSYDNGGVPASATNTVDTWVPKMAKKNGWNVDNKAVGGSGFIDPDNDGTGYLIARATDFSPYNLVVIAYGINDWKAGNHTIGEINTGTLPQTPTTVVEAMQITIEAVMTSNPECKIIGILPINCAGYNFILGNRSTNYGYGYAVNGTTLKQFCETLASVYEYYGIEYVDLVNSSPVNRLNLPNLLVDGVHPTLVGHELLAHELSKRITF